METKQRYQARMQYLEGHLNIKRLLQFSNKLCTAIVFVAYPIFLIWLWRFQNADLLRAILVPLDSFIIVSVFRYLVNRKRPYEAYGIAPAVAKDTKGKSFPSRHVFSAYIIAMTVLCLAPNPVYGIILMSIGILLAAIRVITGVHYLSDVICGAAVGILAGIIGFYMIG